MKYTVKYQNCFIEPYWGSSENKICKHLSIDQYQFGDKETLMKSLKDILDVPDSELTDDEVRIQFSRVNSDLSNEKLVQIKDYYNGRLSIFNKIKDKLDSIIFKKEFPSVIHEEILEKHNSFSIDDNENIKQEESFLEVQVEEVEDYLR